MGDVVDAVATVRPEVVINAVGIVKQRPSAKAYVPSIEVNALFPHLLARVAAAVGARMVHLSTDCVFSGDRGAYTESDPSRSRGPLRAVEAPRRGGGGVELL